MCPFMVLIWFFFYYELWHILKNNFVVVICRILTDEFLYSILKLSDDKKNVDRVFELFQALLTHIKFYIRTGQG